MPKKGWRQTPDKSNEPIARRALPAGAGKRERWQSKPVVAKTPSDRKPIRVFIALFSLSIVIALIAALLWMVMPQAKPHLTIIAADYPNSLLDPNAFATADADALADRRDILDVRHATTESLNRESMNQQIELIREIRPEKAWFFGEPTTAIVYVNAMGFALSDSTGEAKPACYIVPNDFDVPAKRQSLAGTMCRCADILQNLVDAPADRKILILDCQRMDSLWQIGVVENDFLDTFRQEIRDFARNADPKKLEGLFVFASCSEGEVSWPDRALGRSAFANAFLDALSGQADIKGNSDDRIALGELVRYVQDSVRDWSRDRADVQTPTLLYPEGQDALTVADRVRIANASPGWTNWLPAFLAPQAGALAKRSPAPTDDKFFKTLEKQWEEYFQLAMASPRPWHISPVQWRLLGETMRHAEELYRAGKVKDATRALADAARQRSEFSDQVKRLDTDTGFSIPLIQFVRDTNRRLGDLRTEDSPSPFIAPVDELIRNRNFDVFKERVQQDAAKDLIPIEAYLAIQLANVQPDQVDRAASLVQMRRLAEEQVFKAGTWSPQAHYWFEAQANLADTNRRYIEDEFFAQGKQDAKVGTILQSPLNETEIENLYREIGEHAAALARALQAREMALADLPDLVRFAARRPSYAAPENLRQDLNEQLKRLLRALANLNNRLQLDPAKLDPQRVHQAIAEMNSETDALLKQHQEIYNRLEAETREFSRVKSSPETENVWRRIHDILLVPVLVHEPDPARQPAESAKLRVNLLTRVCQSVARSGQKSTDSKGQQRAGNIEVVTDEKRLKRAQALVPVAQFFFETALGEDHPTMRDRRIEASKDTNEIGSVIGQWWRETRFLAVEDDIPPSAERSRLFQADTALRLVDAPSARLDLKSRDLQLRRLDLAEFFEWQAHRHLNDFWAGRQTDEQHYFQRAGEELLNQAREIHPNDAAKDAAFAEAQSRLNTLLTLANGKGGAAVSPAQAPSVGNTGMEIKLLSSDIEFRLGDEERVQVEVATAPNLPTGVASLTAAVDTQNQDRATVIPQTGFGDFRVRRDPAKSDSSRPPASFNAVFEFRGHKRFAKSALNLDDIVRGPTVVYLDRRPDNAEYAIRRAESQAVKLLFVLDCSDSMNKLDSNSGKKRIDILKDVLRKFGTQIEDEKIEVGIRMFGHQTSPTRNNIAAAATDTRLELSIDPFNKTTFLDAVDRAQAKGLTPLFYALLQVTGERDFRGKAGDKQVLIISDGADSSKYTKDNFNHDPVYTPEMVVAEYKKAGIPINSILFEAADANATEQLKVLSKNTGGRHEFAKNSDELLRLIRELSSYHYFANRVGFDLEVPNPPGELSMKEAKHQLTRTGLYDVQVVAGESQYDKASRRILVRPGDLHSLELIGDNLQYNPGFPENDVDRKAAGTVELRVMRVVPQQAGGRTHVDLEFALFKSNDPAWDIQTIHLFITPKGREDQRYACHLFEPNVPGYHYPRYEVRLEDWPREQADLIRDAKLVVSWDEGSIPEPIRFNPTRNARQALDQNRIVAGNFQQPTAPGQFPAATRFTIRFDFQNYLKENIKENPNLSNNVIQNWYVRPGGGNYRTRQALQVYSLENGIYEADMVVDAAGREINELLLYRFDPQANQNATIEMGIRIGGTSLIPATRPDTAGQ